MKLFQEINLIVYWDYVNLLILIVFKKDDSKSDPDDVQAKPDIQKSSDSSQPKIVTQTLGEILVSQKKYLEALSVFETLQEQNPDNKNITKKVDFLKKIVTLEQK